MKRLITVLLLLISSAFGTTTVTGNLKTVGTGSTDGFVRFTLRGCSGNQPRVTGVGVLAPSSGAAWYQDFVADSSGVIAGTIYSTRDNAGTGNGDIECGGSYTAVWYGMQVWQNGKAGPEVAVHAKSGAILDISSVTPITTNPVVTAPTGDTTYARLDAGNTPFTGPVTFRSGVSGNLAVTGNVSSTGNFTSVGSNAIGAIAATGPWTSVSSGGIPVWPALMTLPNGHLYALYISGGGTAVTSSVSTDNGSTWTIGAGPSIPGSTTVLYASLTLLQNGTAFLAYSVANSSTQAAQPGYIIGTISGDTITWGSYTQIAVSGRSYCYDPSPVVQLGNGNLVLPVWCQANATQTYSALDSGVMISTNGGSTWSAFSVIGGSISVTGSSTNGYDESCFALMANNDIVAILRHTNPGDPNGTYARSVSTNGGTSWTSPVETGITNNSVVGRPTCLVFSSKLIMVGRMAGGPFGDMTAGVVSTDEGLTWTVPSYLQRTSGEDEYDALTLYSSGTAIGMVSAIGVSNNGVFFSNLALNGVTAPSGGNFGPVAMTNGYSQNFSISGLTAKAVPVAGVGGLLGASLLLSDSTNNLVQIGSTGSTSAHKRLYFPDLDPVTGYPRVIINNNGAALWCIGDSTPGSFIIGTCATTSSFTSTWLSLNQSGALQLPAYGLGILTSDASGNVSSVGAWTQTTPTPTPGSGSFTTVTSTLRTQTLGKTAHINYVLVITTVGTAAGNITVPLGLTAKSASSVSCVDNAPPIPLAGAGTINAGGTSLFIGKYDGTTFAASGRTIACTGVVELQ